MAIQPVEQGSAFAFRNVINNNFYELKVLSGASKPTQSTVAVVGQMYLDTSEGKMYFCSNVSGSVYTWKLFSEFSGSYNDLEDKPSLFSGNYNDLTNKPDSSKISYNNNLSSLEADNVQNAIDEIISLKAAKNGFATLDSGGKVPSVQLPSMHYIPTDQRGVANGVAALDSNAKVPSSQLPISTSTSSSSTTTVASSGAVKDAYDEALKATTYSTKTGVISVTDGTVNYTVCSVGHIVQITLVIKATSHFPDSSKVIDFYVPGSAFPSDRAYYGWRRGLVPIPSHSYDQTVGYMPEGYLHWMTDGQLSPSGLNCTFNWSNFEMASNEYTVTFMLIG